MSILIPAWVNGELMAVDKMDAHVKGLRHKAVSVFVMDGSKTLIQRRALGKYHTPGQWANTCCTHPEFYEDPAECAKRRLKEELGITGLTPHHRDRIEYRADVGGGLIEHEVVDLFTADATSALPLDLNPDEVMETRWIELDVLRAEIAQEPAKFTPWIRIYMADHSDILFSTFTTA